MLYVDICSVVLLCVGRGIEVAEAKSLIDGTQTTLESFRSDISAFGKVWFEEPEKLAESLGVTAAIPRKCSRQRHRSNVQADTPESHFCRTITIPFLGRYNTEYTNLCTCIYMPTCLYVIKSLDINLFSLCRKIVVYSCCIMFIMLLLSSINV